MLVATAFVIILAVKALTDATLSELLSNSPERFLIQMDYPEMVNKSLMQCENTVNTTLTESLMCVNLVSDIYNLMVITQKQNMERTIAYNGCVIYHNNFVPEVIQEANMTAEEIL